MESDTPRVNFSSLFAAVQRPNDVMAFRDGDDDVSSSRAESRVSIIELSEQTVSGGSINTSLFLLQHLTSYSLQLQPRRELRRYPQSSSYQVQEVTDPVFDDDVQVPPPSKLALSKLQ